jgi:hypothetical protein
MGCVLSQPLAPAPPAAAPAPRKEPQAAPEPEGPEYCGSACPLNDVSRLQHLHGLGVLDSVRPGTGRGARGAPRGRRRRRR